MKSTLTPGRLQGELDIGATLPAASAAPEAAASAAGVALTIYADGACKGNPGPGGWGALLIGADGEQEIFGGERLTTNNRMELTAVIEALAAAPAGSTIALYTDSRYVQQGMSAWIHGWKRKGWRTADGKAVKNVDLWQRLDTAAARHRMSWHWVRGHDGDVGNERADALANRGILVADRGNR